MMKLVFVVYYNIKYKKVLDIFIISDIIMFDIKQLCIEQSEEPDMSEKRLRIGVEIHKLDHLLSRSLSFCVKEAGIDEITMMHGWIIRYLYEHREQDIFQRDIEQHFSTGRSTVTNIIQLMEKKGYVCRRAVERDARLKKVELTQKGISTHEAMESLVNKLDESMIRGIEKDELDTFIRVIHKLKQNVGREKTDDSDFIA